MNICVYGSASNKIDDKYKLATFELGKVLALRGHHLVFGAGGNGLMGAAARGFVEGKGDTLGIVPEFFKENKFESLYKNCTKVIYTTDIHERKRLLENYSDAYIITPGGIGTFDELFSVLTNKQLGRHNKPIAIFNAFGYYEHVIALLKESIRQKFINENVELLYQVFTENQVDEMIKYVETKPSDEKIENLKDG